MHGPFPPSLAQAIADAEARAPGEAVSVYLVGADGAWAFRALTNHSRRPLAFELDPLEWVALERAAAPGVCLVHSHVDGPATLSAIDVAAFTVEGRPLLPGLSLVVLALRRGRVVDEARYVFQGRGWSRVGRIDTLSLQSHREVH
ncbi:MAG: hypothetical protein INH41_30210 [Myxococcaceae bacterium]|jgi:proteasome lid subunit RPN8/RPN11|nr:hypothetical protein [Myxococcaceae bacterium]MCA3016679.1 hypothetical protein [Myxococcaceae bacterium]